MYVKFWGTRGSLPRANSHDNVLSLLERLDAKARSLKIDSLAEIIKNVKEDKLSSPLTFGGDTTCVEICDNEQSAIVDMGSGIRLLGTESLAAGIKKFDIFLTHMHWDHVIGLPFFRPIFDKDCELNIYHTHDNSPEFVKVNFNGINFPVKWKDLPSKTKFHKLDAYKATLVGKIQVTPFTLDHPGEAFGYRFDIGKKSIGIGFDSEFTRVSAKALGKDLKYYQDLDLLIFDGQYDCKQMTERKGWGHSTPSIGAELALREKIKKIAFTHHDPWSGHEKLLNMHEEVKKYTADNIGQYKAQWKSKPEGPDLIYAYDGLKVDV